MVGLQAQAPSPPFVALWARLEGFHADELRALIEAREVVRAPMMRHTVHLVTASDYLLLRGPVQPALERSFAGARKRVTDEQLETALAVARERFGAGSASFADVRAEVAARMPDADLMAVMYGVRTHLRVVGAPTDARWSFDAKAFFVLADDWLGRRAPDAADPSELIRRYLSAFGPATVADVQAWSGVPGLKPAVEAMRGQLLSFRDERGRELFDVPGAPLPDGDTPVPIRFTAEFDNALLGYADRSRIVADEHRRRVFNETKNGRIPGTFLVDGFVAGRWWVERQARGGEATLLLEPFRRLAKAERAEIEAAAAPLFAFLEPDAAAGAVRFASRP